MKPVFVAKWMFETHDERFIDVFDRHLAEGWVYSGDDCFVMATNESRDELLRQNTNKGVDKDTWFIYVYAGNLKRVLELVPFKLKYVAFRRNNGPIKVYEMEKLLRKIGVGV